MSKLNLVSSLGSLINYLRGVLWEATFDWAYNLEAIFGPKVTGFYRFEAIFDPDLPFRGHTHADSDRIYRLEIIFGPNLAFKGYIRAERGRL